MPCLHVTDDILLREGSGAVGGLDNSVDAGWLAIIPFHFKFLYNVFIKFLF